MVAKWEAKTSVTVLSSAGLFLLSPIICIHMVIMNSMLPMYRSQLC
jgi:hypothetical protein